MDRKKFDLTPDPKVLIALTHTPLQQMDALCELVDNAIDSYNAAKKQGIVISSPLISIELPKLSDVEEGKGCVRIIDNGPGLTSEVAEYALRAGFSGNNPYDNLGLFGMGFNISTGKMGSITTMITAREDLEKAIKVKVDLDVINRQKSFEVEPEEVEKPFIHGTCIEITGWWPEGNPNRGFIKKLVQYGNKKIREELGRRYATILRKNEIRITVNGVACEAYEHCVWDDKRFVVRQKHGEIPAVFRFKQVIHAQKRCNNCMTMIESFQSQCPSCASSEFRTLEERIEGWVGIQRFDDLSEFGIDLIRNGRAIRIAEKPAFFEFVDEFKKVIKDYPIDSNFGRIVGEVHMNHVPVDFLKQDFQRSSPEWQRAISFLRGDSSLQPTQPGADQNSSPIYKLYQGYRKVKTPGKTDMYMGYWDTVKQEPHRISRDVEKEFYEKFKNKEQGYYDDAEWWKKVEEADSKPIKDLPLCPSCGAQNLEDAEVCAVCQHILKSKKCINEECKATIPISAKICPECGMNQEPQVLKPWVCEVCKTRNLPTIMICTFCGQPKGTKNTLSYEYLLEHANKDDVLSIDSCSVTLADGSACTPIKVNVYVTDNHIKPNTTNKMIPLLTFKDKLEELNIFVDKSHRMFKRCQMIPEQLIATEIAERIQIINRGLSNSYATHTIPMLSWHIIEKYWADSLEESGDDTNTMVNDLMKLIKLRLSITIGEDAAVCFDELSGEQSKEMANNIINDGEDISNLNSMKTNGLFLKYVGHDFIIKLFDMTPSYFFDDKVWNEDYLNINAPEELKRLSQDRIKSMYKSCLDDIQMFLHLKTQDRLFVKRAMCSLKYLQQKVINDVY